MPLSSLVVSLAPEPVVNETCRRLALDITGLELGVANGRRIPAVLDAPDYETHDSSLEALRQDAGVLFVDVVFHDFSDVSTFASRPRPVSSAWAPTTSIFTTCTSRT